MRSLEAVSVGRGINQLIAPYCQIGALKYLLQVLGTPNSVIVSWRVRDLAMGIGSLELFKVLNELGVELYTNKDLHAKLYLFEGNQAFCGSGNITRSGLGLDDKQNIECGVTVQLTKDDMAEIRKLRDSSIRVDEKVCERFRQEVERVEDVKLDSDGIDSQIYKEFSSGYLLSSLPITPDPASFLKAICTEVTAESTLHDLQTLGISDMQTGDVKEIVELRFKGLQVIEDVYQLIRENGSRSFGQLTSFIHDNCRDVPMPFRSEIKEKVEVLMNWMEYFYEDLYSYKPNYSRVIFDRAQHPLPQQSEQKPRRSQYKTGRRRSRRER